MIAWWITMFMKPEGLLTKLLSVFLISLYPPKLDYTLEWANVKLVFILGYAK